MNILSYKNIVQELLEDVPEFETCEYYNNLVKIESQNLPHMIFGALLNFYLDQYESKNLTVIEKINKLLEYASISNDEKLKELIAVSFLEGLDEKKSNYNEIFSKLGDNTKILLKWIQDYNQELADSL